MQKGQKLNFNIMADNACEKEVPNISELVEDSHSKQSIGSLGGVKVKA